MKTSKKNNVEDDLKINKNEWKTTSKKMEVCQIPYVGPPHSVPDNATLNYINFNRTN